MTIEVICTPEVGMGSCSGHTWDGSFACSTTKDQKAIITGVSDSINWILNHLK